MHKCDFSCNHDPIIEPKASMNQPTTPNTVEDFLPLPEPKFWSKDHPFEDLFTADQVRAAILADRAHRPTVAGSVDTPEFRAAEAAAGVEYAISRNSFIAHINARLAPAAPSVTHAAPVVAGRFPRLWAVLRLSDNVIVQTSSTDGWLGEVYGDKEEYVIAEVAPIAAHPVAGSPIEASREERIGRHVLDFAKRGGWKDDGEGAFEFIQRHSYVVGFEDAGGKVDKFGTQTNGSRWPISAFAPAAAEPMPASEAASRLHAAIMNIPSHPMAGYVACPTAYLKGHKEARHAAAELVSAHFAAPAAPTDAKPDGDPDVPYTYASAQATNCAGCGAYKHTPLRIDAMGGYVCLTCIDNKLGSMLGEFGYPEPDDTAAQSVRDAALQEAAEICDELHYPWKWDDEPDSDSGPRSCAKAIRALIQLPSVRDAAQLRIDELIACIEISTVRIVVMRDTWGPNPEPEDISYVDGDKLINAIKALPEEEQR